MTGIAWNSFEICGIAYDLSHLHPFVMEVTLDSKDGKPAQKFIVNVSFSLHCFTRGKVDGEVVEEEWLYTDSREERVICLDRHQLSSALPEVIRQLHKRKCYHTGHDNYVTIEIVEGDKTENYNVFFAVSKAGKGQGLNLYVQSAYVPDKIPVGKAKKPIKLSVILYNKLHNRPIKLPR